MAKGTKEPKDDEMHQAHGFAFLNS